MAKRPEIGFNLVLTGKVFTGKGEGKRYLSLPWVKQQIKNKLGFTPFMGTLNLRLTEKSITNKAILEKMETIKICPEKGYCVGTLFEADIKGLAEVKCAIIIPQVADYPKENLEIISSFNLREKLKLEDGDSVSVKARA
jgi:riboflavin kinase